MTVSFACSQAILEFARVRLAVAPGAAYVLDVARVPFPLGAWGAGC